MCLLGSLSASGPEYSAVEVGFSAGFWVVVLGEAVEVGFSAGFCVGALGEVVLDFGNWSIQRKKNDGKESNTCLVIN